MPKRKRAGRKRNYKAPRKPCGRISTPTVRQREDDVRSVVLAYRKKQGMSDEEARSNAGDAIGLALQREQITREEEIALRAYAEVRYRYFRNIGVIDNPKAAQFERSIPSTADDSRSDKGATDEWDRITTRLSAAGRGAHMAVAALAWNDVTLMPGVTRHTRGHALDCGLRGLTAHFGLSAPRD